MASVQTKNSNAFIAIQLTAVTAGGFTSLFDADAAVLGLVPEEFMLLPMASAGCVLAFALLFILDNIVF